MARAVSSASLVMVLFLTLVPVTPAGGQVLCRSEADDIAALRTFDRAVNAYVELHHRLDAPVAPLRICSDPEAIAAAKEGLADAIRAERPEAARGDVFGPEVADLFRMRIQIAHAGEERGATAVPAGLEGGVTPCTPLPVVNARFAWAGSEPIGEDLAHALPALPLELDYRVVGRALVLVDVTAGLVVDVLAEAFP